MGPFCVPVSVDVAPQLSTWNLLLAALHHASDTDFDVVFTHMRDGS
jgi:hypothetical protein